MKTAPIRAFVRLACLVLGILAGATAFAQGSEAGGAATDAAIIGPVFERPAGFSLGFNPWLLLSRSVELVPQYRIRLYGDVDTVFKASLGGYHNDGYWTHPGGAPVDRANAAAGGAPVVGAGTAAGGAPSPAEIGIDDTRITFKRRGLQWSVGIDQGLTYDRVFLGKLLAFARYRGLLNENLENESPADSLVFASGLADERRSLTHSFIIGLVYQDQLPNKLYNTKRGTVASLSFEAGPSWFGNDAIGLSDYFRSSAWVINALPLLERFGFSCYLTETAAFDLAWGSSVPIAVRQSMGGYLTMPGYAGLPGAVGGLVRGTLGHDGTMKFYHGLDLRASFPSLLDTGLVPGLTLTYDLGLWDDSDHRFSFDRFVHSAGANFWLHLDSIAIVPFSALLDLQVGVIVDLEAGEAEIQPGDELSILGEKPFIGLKTRMTKEFI